MAKLTLADLTNLTANEASTVATINANSALIEAALEKTLSRDGTSPNSMGTNLDMNSYRVMNLPAALSGAEPVRKAEFDALALNGVVFSNLTIVDSLDTRFGAVGDGTTDDTEALQGIIDYLVSLGGGTLLLVRPHLITAPLTNTTNVPLCIRGTQPTMSKLIVHFTSAAYPSGASAIDFSYDLSYNNNSVWIDNIGIYLSSTSGTRLSTAIDITYADRQGPTGSVIISNCRIDKNGSRYWLKGIYLDTAPQSKILDNAIFAGAGTLSSTKVGYGIHIGTWGQGTMIHRNSMRGSEYGIYCNSDSVEDAEDFQSEGISVRWNKAQNCDWGLGLSLSDNEVAWAFTDNDFDCGKGGFYIRNLLRFIMANNSDGWNNTSTDHCGVLLEYDTGTLADYATQNAHGLIDGMYTYRRSNIDFDVTGVTRGATTSITYSNTGVTKNITSMSIAGDGAITLTLNSVTALRNNQRVVLTGITTPTQLNNLTCRINDLNTAAKTVRLYQNSDKTELVDGTGYAGYTGSGVLSRLYSTGTLVDGDKVWIDGVVGTTEINETPYIVQDVTSTTARLTNYYTGANIDSSAWTAWSDRGNITRYGRAIEIRGGNYISMDNVRVFERNVGLHLWPETKNINWKNPVAIPSGPNIARSILNDSSYKYSVKTDAEASYNDGGAVGDGTTDDTSLLQAVLTSGKSLSLNPLKTYLITKSLSITVSGTGINGNGATLSMSTATGHFDNADYSARTGTSAVAVRCVGTSGSRITKPFIRNTIIRPSSWIDDRYLKAIYVQYTRDIEITGNEIYNFSRGGGLIAGDNLDYGTISRNTVRDCYTNSTVGSSGTTDPRITAISLDGSADSLTDTAGIRYGSRGVEINENIIRNITQGSASVTALTYQSNAIVLSGNNNATAASAKPSRDIIVRGNIVENVGQGVDCYGFGCVISGNKLKRCFSAALKVANGGSNNLLEGNVCEEGGQFAMQIGPSNTIGAVNADSNTFRNNIVRNLNRRIDWWNADGNKSHDSGGGATAPFPSGAVAMRVQVAAGYASQVANTIFADNDIDCGSGDETFGFYMEVAGGAGSSTQIVQHNHIRGCTRDHYLDTNGYATVRLPQQGPGSTLITITETAATHTLAETTETLTANRAGTITVTLGVARKGRRVRVKTITANTVVSASSNVIPLAGGAAGTAILAATAGKWAILEGNGSNWEIIASN